MTLLRKVIVTLIVVCTVPFGFAQIESLDAPVKVSNPAKMKALAKNAMKNRDAYLALHYYEEYSALKPNDVETTKSLAELYKITRNYNSAVLAYDKLYKSDKVKYLSALYEKGIMQKMIGSYDSAKVNLVDYKRLGGKTLSKSRKKQLKIDVEGCDSALLYIEFPERVEIVNAGSVINNPHVEFGPIPVDDNKILYGSLTSDTVHFYDVTYDNKVEQPHRKFYLAEKNGDAWVSNELEKINDADFEMGKIVYSAPTKTYYFSKCEKDSHGRTSCDLYSGKEKKNKSMAVHKLPLPINAPASTTTQPSVYYDTTRKTDVLYFVSDRLGGKGGLDIYYSIYNKRKKVWGKAKNLGGRVNTPGTDCTPFYDYENTTLYFSSDGFPSMGGLDVFKSVKDKENRTLKAINMGVPVNSSQDDLDFSIHKNNSSGYVVSNRPGGTPYMHETCCDDIFEVEILPELPFVSDIDFLVASVSGDSLENDKLIIEKRDLRTGKLVRDTMLLANGTEHLELEKNKAYKFTVLKEGYEPDTYMFDTKNGGFDGHHEKKFNLVPIESEIPKVAIIDTMKVKTDTVTPVVSTLALNAEKEIIVKEKVEKVMTNEVVVTEEVIAVVDKKPKQIEPVVAKVIEEPKEVVKEILEVKEEKIIEPVVVLEKKVEKITEPKVIEEVKEVVTTPVVVTKAKKPSKLDLLYEFDKFVLRESDRKEIDDVLISYMIQNPSSKVVISSHTDSRGSDIYNQYLSDQRMKQVVAYIESKGIDKERVSAKGYGETKLKIKDTNDAGLYIIPYCKQNRRTEVDITE